jgi:3-isopropylmalate/(R)-2-methylmalate dehydratase small subunit
MQPFTTHTGIGAPLKRSNVDTDQIIPAVYLKRVTRTGFEDALFEPWRTNEPDFVLNQDAFKGASILVAGPEFGTGSSREHAVWAFKDYGFRVVFSSRFADIFRNNSGKQGLLAAVLHQEDIENIWDYLEAEPGSEMTVNLNEQKVYYGDFEATFEVDEHTRHRLLNGLDDIDLTMQFEDDIAKFEASRPSFKPKTLPARTEGDAKIESAPFQV